MAIRTAAAFEAMYRANYEDVLAFVRRRAHPMTVDDVVGETFLISWRRRADLPEDVRPWLFRTARNLMLNASRSGNRQRALALRLAADYDAHACDPMGFAGTRVDFTAAWQALSAADRELLALHVWEGLKDRDAAKVLSCSRAGYSMRLSRAKRRLAKLAGSATTLSPVADLST